MIRLGHITAKTYLMVSLILTAAFVLSFIGEGFSADPQGGSMAAKPPSKTQPVVPQELCPECMPQDHCPECMPSQTKSSKPQPGVPQKPSKSQAQDKGLEGVDVKTKTSVDKQGNTILSSDVSITVKIESLLQKDLEKNLQDFQTGFHKGIVDGLELAKKGGSYG